MKTGRIVLKKTKQQTMNQKSLECMKEFIQLLCPFFTTYTTTDVDVVSIQYKNCVQ